MRVGYKGGKCHRAFRELTSVLGLYWVIDNDDLSLYLIADKAILSKVLAICCH